MPEYSELAGHRATVFGAQGFLGSHLVSELAGRGAQVTAFDIETPEPANQISGVVSVTGDITDNGAVREAVNGVDLVFAFAGGIGARGSLHRPLADLESSCTAQLILLEAVRELAPRASVVFPGSRLEYGRPQYLPVNEDHPLKGDSPYAVHKTACASYYRLYASNYGMQTTVLRLPNPYGSHAIGQPERRLYGIINLFVDRLLSGRPITLYGNGKQLRDFIHVDDVVAATIAAATTTHPPGQTYNIGSGKAYSLEHAALTIIDALGSGRIETGVEWPRDAAVVESGDFFFDISRAKSALGWEPRVDLFEGIQRTVSETKAAWLRSMTASPRNESGE